MVHQVISDYNHEAVIAEYIRTKGRHTLPDRLRGTAQASVNKATAQHWKNMQVETRPAAREKAAARARLFWSVDLSTYPQHKIAPQRVKLVLVLQFRVSGTALWRGRCRRLKNRRGRTEGVPAQAGFR